MATVTITKENAQQTANGNDVVFLEFWASWCPSCRAFNPVYESAAERHRDLVFGTVNTEEQRELAGAFGVRLIPTVVAIKNNAVVGVNAGAMSLIVRDNIVIFSQPGALPESALTELIGKAREVDMDEVRASVEAEQAGATS